MIELIEYLFGVVFVKLRLAAISSPKAEDFRFGTVGHVDDAFKPPALHDGTANSTQDQAVVTNFQESQITGSISPYLNGKTVPVHLT